VKLTLKKRVQPELNDMPEIITPQKAFSAGLNKYFTGVPCKQGHICERYIRNGGCVQCTSSAIRRWKDRNPEKIRQYWKKAKATDPDRLRANLHRYRTANIELVRSRDAEQHRNLRKRYPEREKIRGQRTRDKRNAKLEQIAGRKKPAVCDICHEVNIRIVFDHCHVSGHFRGWLCDRCNRVLGIVKESPELLMALRDYLKGATRDEADNDKTQQYA
jgi:hypothetical protein